MSDLQLDLLHPSLADDDLTSMNFLNEIALRYPDAVSFAAGRPLDDHFSAVDVHRWLDLFLARGGGSASTLFQYGPTKGIIGDLIAEHLRVDERITAAPEAVMVTVGCQEAIHLVLRALRRDDRDVVLAVAPTYVGFTGAARTLDLPVVEVRDGADGIDLADLAATVRRLRDQGLRPRACYVMPDFANPSGRSMDTELRRRLLHAAAELDLLLLEDNAYGFFGGTGPARPTLKALDEERRVVYLGSFAKTILPGLRIGYLVADQVVSAPGVTRTLFADELAKLKSVVTVNTAPLAQAVAGGRLIECGFRLRAAGEPQAATYRRNRAQMLAGLARRFGGPGSGSRVTWNSPDGGFFLVCDVPMVVDDALLETAAADYGVIFTPMSYFMRGGGSDHQLRLSFSRVTPAEIETGLDRLAALVSER
ncbi:PLP-dependent aminotransferase family protein [Actinoplanes sp. DH11]|uniref:aminotransferase-like domain-containing protein n=1 Tax=Actinoplanes sp. DH11 TaxID=2857011 RepID=UPI001E455EF7|nr:PLP-dependent aminotransferase family protein [Actinoplanes sp. DH11]